MRARGFRNAVSFDVLCAAFYDAHRLSEMLEEMDSGLLSLTHPDPDKLCPDFRDFPGI